MKRTAKNPYRLHTGMVIKKDFYGRPYEVEVVKYGTDFRFKLDGKIFDSLTAAARYVCRDETRTISGPKFWGLPLR